MIGETNATVATRKIEEKRALTTLLIYSLYASSWTARGKDEDMTKAAKDAQGIEGSVDAGNFIKSYLPGCAELKAINSYLGAARAEFYNKTVPWGEIRNVRAGKVEEHMSLMEWVGDIQEGMVPLLEALGAVYLERMEHARYVLQSGFDPEDYPPLDEVLSRFKFRVSVRPLTDVNDIRVMTEIPELERRRLEEEVQTETKAAMQESLKYALDKLHGPIANMAKQLQKYQAGETKILHESLVDNILEMAEAAKVLNITNDPKVNELAAWAHELVAGISKKDLKDSDGLRVDKAKEAEKLAARIAALF